MAQKQVWLRLVLLVPLKLAQMVQAFLDRTRTAHILLTKTRYKLCDLRMRFQCPLRVRLSIRLLHQYFTIWRTVIYHLL